MPKAPLDRAWNEAPSCSFGESARASTPSRQLTFTPAIRVPSGIWPTEWLWIPQVAQKRCWIVPVLNLYSVTASAPRSSGKPPASGVKASTAPSLRQREQLQLITSSRSRSAS